MAVFRGADEIVVGGVENLGHFAEARRQAVAQLARRDAFAAGRLLHLDAVLVRAREEINIAAVEPVEAGDDVRGDQLVSVANVGRAVGVADRSRDVIGLLNVGHGVFLPSFGPTLGPEFQCQRRLSPCRLFQH